MKIRFYIDPESGEPHIARHGVTEQEVEELLARPMEDRPGAEGCRVALGQTAAGPYLRIIYVPDADPDSVFVVTGHDLGRKAKRALKRRRKEEAMTRQSRFPPDWDEAHVQRLFEHYEVIAP